jgi:hypothetical protein
VVRYRTEEQNHEQKSGREKSDQERTRQDRERKEDREKSEEGRKKAAAVNFTATSQSQSPAGVDMTPQPWLAIGIDTH